MSQLSGCKVALLGRSKSGKTCLVERYVHNIYRTAQDTIGASFHKKDVVIDGASIELLLWDTSGEERFESMIPIYYRKAKAALVCFDVGDLAAWNKVAFWVGEMRAAEPACRMYIVATKLDSVDDRAHQRCVQRVILAADARRFASEHNAQYFETSALTGVGVNELFDAVARDFVTTRGGDVSADPSTVVLSNAGPGALGWASWCSC